MHQWRWFALPFQRQHPNIVFGLRVKLLEEQEPAIGGPIGWRLGVARLQQRLLIPHSADRFYVNIGWAGSIGVEGHAITIRGPNRAVVKGGRKGQPRSSFVLSR